MIPSPYLTNEEIIAKDLKEVDFLVATIAPSLRRIVSIVHKHGVKNFAVYIKDVKGLKNKQFNFVMVEEDAL